MLEKKRCPWPACTSRKTDVIVFVIVEGGGDDNSLRAMDVVRSRCQPLQNSTLPFAVTGKAFKFLPKEEQIIPLLSNAEICTGNVVSLLTPNPDIFPIFRDCTATRP